jgi:ferritin-like metal-binding protein YciE
VAVQQAQEAALATVRQAHDAQSRLVAALASSATAVQDALAAARAEHDAHTATQAQAHAGTRDRVRASAHIRVRASACARAQALTKSGELLMVVAAMTTVPCTHMRACTCTCSCACAKASAVKK